MVDVDSFLKKAQPKARRSSLKPFQEQILKLRANNLSLQQVVQFLAESGLQTTVGNVSKFIKKVTEETPKRRATDVQEKSNPAPPDGGNGSDTKLVESGKEEKQALVTKESEPIQKAGESKAAFLNRVAAWKASQHK